MTEPLTKFVPLTVRVKVTFPAVIEDGLRLERVGTGLLMVNVWAGLSPPPDAAVKTVTFAVPAVAIFAASILAVSFVLLTYVVVRAAPFQRMTVPEMKLLPLAVRVKPPLPAMAVVGLMESRVGGLTGLTIGQPTSLSTPNPTGPGL